MFTLCPILLQGLTPSTLPVDSLGQICRTFHARRALSDMYGALGDTKSSVEYAEAALENMVQLVGSRSHPVLEQFYAAVAEAKEKVRSPNLWSSERYRAA